MKKIKAPESPKAQEREFGEALERMIEQMAREFRRAIRRPYTDGQFVDAQYNLLSIANIRDNILAKFTADKIGKFVQRYTGRVDRRNKAELARRIGVERSEIDSEALQSRLSNIKTDMVGWVEKLRDDTLQKWVSGTIEQMSDGKGLDEILLTVDELVEQRKNHAKMVARTQVSQFNSLTTKARAEELGIKKAVWVSAHDSRVRDSHKARDGQEFDLAVGLYSSLDGKTLLPGVDYQCRCDYRLIVE